MTVSESPSENILVVDDDPDARGLVVEALESHGFEVSEAADGVAAKELFGIRSAALVILDLGLPGLDGLDVLRWFRADGDVPVIVLTGRSDPSDRVVGLELGADDYVVKPFDPRELVARVNAVLRRGRPAVPTSRLDYGDLVIDINTHDVSCNGAPLTLTAKEFDLLVFLAASPRQVFSRAQILENVWHSSVQWQDPATVNEHVHRLRRKIDATAGSHLWIETMRGAGYRFTP